MRPDRQSDDRVHDDVDETIGRKRKNAVITDARGNRARGNAVLRISRPPPTTDRAPCLTDMLTKRKANRHNMRLAR